MRSRWPAVFALLLLMPAAGRAGDTTLDPSAGAGDEGDGRVGPLLAVSAVMGPGFYSMTDMRDAYDAMADASSYDVHSDSFGPGETWEFAAGLTIGVGRQWAICVTGTLLKEDVCLKLEDGGWFDAWQCDASIEAGGYTVAVGVIRYLPARPSDTRPFVRLAAGYGSFSLEGYGDDLSYTGTAAAPLVEASVGVDFGSLGFIGVTLEGGLRFMRFGHDDVDVEAEGTTDMDAALARFLEEGTTDFSGWFIRAGFHLGK